MRFADLTTLGVGGHIRHLARWATEHELRDGFAALRDAGMPWVVVGGGSNLVASDEPWDGVVVQLTSAAIEELARDAEGAVVRVDAGVAWDDLVRWAVERGLQGVECMSGIPGSVGAAPIQNIGAYGQEVSDVVVEVRAFDPQAGRFVDIAAADCAFGYRTSRFRARDRGLVIVAVTLRLAVSERARLAYAELAARFEGRAAPPTLAEAREAVLAIRRGKGMVVDPADPDSRSAGSFFTNPLVDAGQLAAIEQRAEARGLGAVPRWPQPDGRVKVPAAWLIERAGVRRGDRRGSAAVSSKHVLAIVACGDARAADVRALAAEIRARVLETWGVTLQQEPLDLDAAAWRPERREPAEGEA